MWLTAGCGRRPVVRQLSPFSITNEIVGGEYQEVLATTNGVSLYFTSSDLVVWFKDGSSFVVKLDITNQCPLNILLNRVATKNQPSESVMDLNADGVPDLKEVHGDRPHKEIFYKGEWYVKQNIGTNPAILIDGRQVPVRFTGGHFEAVRGP